MEKSNVEILFSWLDENAAAISQRAEELYLDALAIAMETLFFKEVPDDFDDILSHTLKTALKQIDLDQFTKTDIRKAVQLAILKGMKDSTQDKHMMTPEAIALLVAYLARKLAGNKEGLRIFDPAGGTANLLTTVLSELPEDAQGYAAEIDPTLIQLALANANLQQMQIEFFPQDALRPLLLDPVDLVVSDLPVGYYPGDSSEFELKAPEGHSYAHHLFIEQGLKYTKPGGYLIFMIPDFLFESDQAQQLHRFLHEHAHIIGLLRLPETAFKTKKQIKSIFILQKKSADSKMPKTPLLAQFPSLKNAQAMQDLLSQIDAWFKKYEEEK